MKSVLAQRKVLVHLVLAQIVLVLAQLACGSSAPRPPIVLYPSNTPATTQTPVLVHITQQVTVLAQATVLVQTTPTPRRLCVLAQEAVYLRPSASETGYPITPLPNGTEVYDLGGRSEGFYFVKLSDNRQGWIYEKYIGDCK